MNMLFPMLFIACFFVPSFLRNRNFLPRTVAFSNILPITAIAISIAQGYNSGDLFEAEGGLWISLISIAFFVFSMINDYLYPGNTYVQIKGTALPCLFLLWIILCIFTGLNFGGMIVQSFQFVLCSLFLLWFSYLSFTPK